MGPKTPVTLEATKAQMCLIAASLTFVAWAFGLGFAVREGKGFSQASSAAAVDAVCGLAGWVAYHIVTRRNNAFGGFVILAICPSHSTSQYPLSLSSAAHFLLLQIAIGLLLGLIRRGLNALMARKPAAGRSGPLYDAELDQVA